MTPKQLRELADRLSDPASPDDDDLESAADYLRAQADAQPVPAVPAGWKVVPVEPTPEMLAAARDWSIQKNGIAVGNDQATGCFQAMLAAAPATPQGALLESHRRLVERAIQDAERPSGMSTHDGKAHIDASVLRRMLAIIDSLPAVPQAEPKREPNPDEVICPACTHQFRAIPENVQAQLWAKTESEAAMLSDDDRELLELAAKAAGLNVEFGTLEDSGEVREGAWLADSFDEWNPLTDDGDALRLAVKVGMEFAADDEATHCAFAYARVRGAGDSHIFEPVVDDPCKAMRRAIVRAAAEIGRQHD